MPGKLDAASRALWVRAATFRRAIPLTATGGAVATLAVAALWFGASRQDLVFTLAGAWGGILVLATGWMSVVGCLSFRALVRRGVDCDAARNQRLDLLEGLPMVSGFATRARAWPLLLRPSWSWRQPPAEIEPFETDDGVGERVTASSRFLARRIERELEVGDVLGLWRVRTSVTEERTVRALPDVGALGAAELHRTLSPSDDIAHPFGPPRGDRADFRGYGPSDPARFILWKAFARTRELMLRIPEPARTPERRPLTYLVAGPGDSAAAGAARVAVEGSSHAIGLLFAADGRPRPTSEREEALDAIAGSIEHRERGGRDLAAALASPDLDADAPVIVFCPAREAEWTAALARMSGREPGRFTFVVCCDATVSPESPEAWERWVLRPPPPRRDDEASSSALERIALRLAGAGARVVIAERASGRVSDVGGPWIDTSPLGLAS